MRNLGIDSGSIRARRILADKIAAEVSAEPAETAANTARATDRRAAMAATPSAGG
jgi:hypothetical protein